MLLDVKCTWNKLQVDLTAEAQRQTSLWSRSCSQPYSGGGGYTGGQPQINEEDG